MLITYHSENSTLKSEGAPVEEIEIDNDNQKYYIYYKRIHNSLYEFFSNLSSILDRLAYEINLLYGLDNWIDCRLNWNKLTNPQNKYFKELKLEDGSLYGFLEENITIFKDANNYRNRLIHDAVLNAKIDSEGFPRKFHILLPDNPEDINSSYNNDAIEYCGRLKKDVLNLLNRSYELILNHIETHGKPPWNKKEALNAQG